MLTLRRSNPQGTRRRLQRRSSCTAIQPAHVRDAFDLAWWALWEDPDTKTGAMLRPFLPADKIVEPDSTASVNTIASQYTLLTWHVAGGDALWHDMKYPSDSNGSSINPTGLPSSGFAQPYASVLSLDGGVTFSQNSTYGGVWIQVKSSDFTCRRHRLGLSAAYFLCRVANRSARLRQRSQSQYHKP